LEIYSKEGLSYMNNSVIIEEITKRIEMKKEYFEKLVSQKKYLISQLTNYRELLLEELRNVDREIANFENIWKENKTKKAISSPRKGKRVFPPPGTILKAKYKGAWYEATVKEGDVINFNGKDYNSPSAAGVAVLPPGRTVNGWTFWRMMDPKSEEWKTMDEVCQRNTN
jgi:hypothetical protein